MNRIETNMNLKTITITNDFVCCQQGGIGKEIIIAVDELQQENKLLKERINKAIEYLYTHSQYNDGDGVHYINEDEYCIDYLLEILKGDSNE